MPEPPRPAHAFSPRGHQVGARNPLCREPAWPLAGSTVPAPRRPRCATWRPGFRRRCRTTSGRAPDHCHAPWGWTWGPTTPGCSPFSVHHLIADGPPIASLLVTLERANRCGDRARVAPRSRAGFAAWCRTLSAFGSTGIVQRDVEHWREPRRKAKDPVPAAARTFRSIQRQMVGDVRFERPRRVPRPGAPRADPAGSGRPRPAGVDAKLPHRYPVRDSIEIPAGPGEESRTIREGITQPREPPVLSSEIGSGSWSGKPESNRRQLAWEASALPTELFPRASFYYIKRTKLDSRFFTADATARSAGPPFRGPERGPRRGARRGRRAPARTRTPPRGPPPRSRSCG